jgi:hypothetical protein
MKRRTFIKNAPAAALGTGILPAFSSPNDILADREFYELRVYHLKSGGKLNVYNNYLSKAVIPAMNALGINNIGIFTEWGRTDPPKLYMLIPYTSPDQLYTVPQKMAEQSVYKENAAEYLGTDPNSPNYTRIESSFMVAFSGIPAMKVPAQPERVFELRNYESFSEEAGMRKIAMFNKGELDIFYKTALNPVFFGEVLIGQNLPSLTYMLVFKDVAERDANWEKFIAHPDWKKMSGMPEYANTVSQVNRTFLVPTAYSQV